MWIVTMVLHAVAEILHCLYNQSVKWYSTACGTGFPLIGYPPCHTSEQHDLLFQDHFLAVHEVWVQDYLHVISANQHGIGLGCVR